MWRWAWLGVKQVSSTRHLYGAKKKEWVGEWRERWGGSAVEQGRAEWNVGVFCPGKMAHITCGV